MPGPVLDDGTVLQCVNLGWGKFNVSEKMSEMFHGIEVKAGNDANVAALGEAWKGGGKNFDDIVMVTLGTGVGGGVILEGKFLQDITVQQAKSVTCMLKMVKNLTVTAAVADALNSMHQLQV